jgi:transcriptional regulator with XRE-family HTH domain
MKTTIGQFIHELRITNGMTLTQLGAKIGIDSGALSKIENGKKSMDPKCLPLLAETFSLNLKDLKENFISEKLAFEILDNSCDESVLTLIEQKIKLLKSKNIKQAELNF